MAQISAHIDSKNGLGLIKIPSRFYQFNIMHTSSEAKYEGLKIGAG